MASKYPVTICHEYKHVSPPEANSEPANSCPGLPCGCTHGLDQEWPKASKLLSPGKARSCSLKVPLPPTEALDSTDLDSKPEEAMHPSLFQGVGKANPGLAEALTSAHTGAGHAQAWCSVSNTRDLRGKGNQRHTSCSNLTFSCCSSALPKMNM